MEPRQTYPPGVPCWIDLTPPDLVAAKRFYGGLFGWQFEERGPGGPYVVAQLDGQSVAGIGAPTGSPSPATAWTTYIAVEDADDTARRITEAGGRIVADPADVPGAGRVAMCTDPTGAEFGIWQATGHAGAQLVNASGSWNWSLLDTTDPEAATAFYGSVFGWTTHSLELGPDEITTMWCLPGYGDFLASIDPEVRRRHAEAEAPEGFTDSVAWMSKVDATSPSSWSITFAVDDPDGVVERAAELGGKVVSPPVDLGVVRQAEVEDPFGAAFTVSRYQPD
jgi:predicted enzyme related to lactoylglutathione lyase